MENKGTDTAAPTDALDILSEIPAGGTAAAAPEPEATSLDSGPTSTTSALYRAAIGKVSTDFYQRVFDRFETAERTGPSWNWAAALITFNWMVFRKLWLAALVYVGALVATLVSVLGLGKLVFQWSSPLETGLLGLLALVFVAVPGVYGNALLHWASRKKMAQALATNATVPEACAMLEQQASTKQRLIWIALANALLVGATVGISVALPDADRLPQSPGAMEQAQSAPSAAASSPNTTPIAPPPIPAASAPAAAMESAAAASAPASSTAPAPAAAEPVAVAVSPAAPAPLPAPNKATAATIATAPAAVVTIAPPAPLAPPAPAVVEKPAAPEKPAAKASSAPANKAAEKTQASPITANTATSDAAAGKKIYINVGLFAKESNAHNAHDKLARAGLPAKEQQVTGTKGTFTRVRVGPYKTMAAAEKAAEKIRGQGLEAVVVRQ
jgi:cell division protein FtsN